VANAECLESLAQGSEYWNRWRYAHEERVTEISGAYPFVADLSGAKLVKAQLGGVDLSGADLTGADFTGANLMEANLSGTKLHETNLTESMLQGTNLSYATLVKVNLSGANLEGANFYFSDIVEANFAWAKLNGMNLSSARLVRSIFVGVNLREVKGLDSVRPGGFSQIGFNTLQLSEGEIPEEFLRECGFSDWQIESAKLCRPQLENHEIEDIVYRVYDLRAHQAILINPVFLSYNHLDCAFVDRMENYFSEKGIRYWRDIRHAMSGRLEKQVDRAIRYHPIFLLIISANCDNSDWVQHEARLARQLEVETQRDILCPIALDTSWKLTSWPKRLKEQIEEYNILDFSEWQDEKQFQRMAARLLGGLHLFYKG
jgi:hypothetical protein